MKKLCLGIFVALAIIVGFSARIVSAEEIRIGVLVPLTGGAASYGQNSRKGAELAVKEFTPRNPNIKVDLSIEDSRGEAAVGTRAASKLIELDHVAAIVGCVTSGVTLAVAPIMNERKVPLISPGGSSPNITAAGDYVFRTWPSDVFEADAMAHYIADKGIKKLAILRINNEYGLAMEHAIEEKVRSLRNPVAIVSMESFEQGARDMRTQLLKIKKSAADSIYFVGFPEAAIVFSRAYKNAGLRVPI
ncbi:MAG: ABC transporter substrate-binding protein, partial [Nitrososphaera sp.]|nr:ABC transporter substrate-binding protein [Nitrososphaera sp.]